MNRFISESEVEEKRKQRQEEWEKVRNKDDPEEAPEEPYDPRSLYDRLQEQEEKKQRDFEEKLKFKNQFRGIDQDEANFLVNVATHAAKQEKQKNDEMKQEIEDFKKAIANREQLQYKTSITKHSTGNNNVMEKQNYIKKKSAQTNILKMAVKRKRNVLSSEPTKAVPQLYSDNSQLNVDEDIIANKKEKHDDENLDDHSIAKNINKESIIVYPSAQKCVGILPGISGYDDSDSSSSESVLIEDSSSST